MEGDDEEVKEPEPKKSTARERVEALKRKREMLKKKQGGEEAEVQPEEEDVVVRYDFIASGS